MLRQVLANFSWGDIIADINCRTDSIDNIYNDFVNIVKYAINSIVSERKISMLERDPPYITPRFKILFRKHKFRRAGKMKQTDYIAVKVNRQVARERSTALAGVSDTDTKQLWSLLRRTGNWA